MKTYLLIVWSVLVIAIAASAQNMLREAPAGYGTTGIDYPAIYTSCTVEE